MSKFWAITILLAGVLNLPARADEPATGEEATSQATSSNSPIPRLAEVRLDQNLVPARMINLPLPGRTTTVQEMLDKLKDWSDDDKVGAILLDIDTVSLPLPDIEELRRGITEFRKQDKKVLAFINSATPEGYLVACAADEIALAPCGTIIIPGIGRVFPYMKGYYQMQGIEYDVITCGAFKYPGFVNQREPNKYFVEEFGALLDSWISEYKSAIAKGRNLSDATVTELVDIGLFKAEDALQRGLVDKLAYYDDYRERTLSRFKMKKYRDSDSDLEKVNTIQDIVELINKELQKAQEQREAVGPKIAVLNARGPIVDMNLGAGFASQIISRDNFVEVVEELRKNDSIKAVVMHIDSPGGSAYASDIIWRHLKQLNDEKPLVVSMGSVAASGGYYLSCPGRRVFAHPTTLTGSIGVLSIFQSARSQINRMDVELSEMKRGARSLLGSSHTEMSREDRDAIQQWMNAVYDMFLDRVAEGRRMPADEVRKIAGGRIYSGRDALKIGLVDELGGLKDAIACARQMANIPPSAEVQIVQYPRPSSLGEFLVDGFGAVNATGVTSEQSLVAWLKAAQPAVAPSFDQQLQIFAQRPQALCWLAMPAFYRPTVTAPLGGLLGHQPAPGLQLMNAQR